MAFAKPKCVSGSLEQRTGRRTNDPDPIGRCRGPRELREQHAVTSDKRHSVDAAADHDGRRGPREQRVRVRRRRAAHDEHGRGRFRQHGSRGRLERGRSGEGHYRHTDECRCAVGGALNDVRLGQAACRPNKVCFR